MSLPTRRNYYKLTTIEDEYDIPYTTLLYHIKRGKLRAVKLEGRYYVKHDDLMAMFSPVTPQNPPNDPTA